MRRFFARLANLFRGPRAEREMAREIASHLALLAEDFERRGMSADEAALAARRSYGGVEQAKELHREGPVAMQRETTRVLAAFSGVLTLLSLALAGVGVHGVMAFLVSQRTREIGIRIALGATSRAVIGRVVVQGLLPVFLGMAIGFPAAAAIDLVTSTDGVRDSMFLDPAAYALLAVVLAIAVVASIIPARRALRVDPMVALRHE